MSMIENSKTKRTTAQGGGKGPSPPAKDETRPMREQPLGKEPNGTEPKNEAERNETKPDRAWLTTHLCRTP